MTKANIPPVYIAAGVVAVIALFAIREIGSAAWSAGSELVDKTVDLASGALTGNNAITQGARTTAYQGAGVVGTLGAATDRTLGGAPSRVGETIGIWLYDLTH